MKLSFEPNLDYQRQAIESVCDLFAGQEFGGGAFTLARPADMQHAFGVTENELGLGNALSLTDDVLLENLRAIQMRNGLALSPSLDSGDFTVEMETGTGKTYVYLRTIFELHRRFGFVKFVIVVPSLAVKEGVYKTLQITAEHFRSLYEGTPCEYFVYDSARLSQVRSFATSTQLQIMIVTVGAINKSGINNIYKDREETFDQRPIDLIRATHPVIIVDEPQSVDGGLTGAGKTALEAMDPLCTLRYSATHANEHHMVYRLDAVDAYEGKLVKQIAVASATVETAHNKPFVRLISVRDLPNDVSATIELDVRTASGVKRKKVRVHDGVDLESITRRALYRDHRIGEIVAAPGRESLELRTPGDEAFLAIGESWGDVAALPMQREMIRRTIREHLDKALRLHPRGIKVLSLFFVDSVDQYRAYDQTGNATKGPCARIFEEEYLRFSRHPEYRDFLASTSHPVEEVHNGYFSIDRKNKWTDTDDRSQSSRENAERAYHLIMREKERLLEFSTPLAFIFSHSALREGWDNPNVFQLCSLRDIRSEQERRQTIGRGLRLCVNQDGDRVRDPDVNVLTVVATESYEEFAKGLQKEMERAGVRFGFVEVHQFAGILGATEDGTASPSGIDRSRAVWEHLRRHSYIDADGRVQEALRTAVLGGTLSLPDLTEDETSRIAALLRRLTGRVEVRNADDGRAVHARREVLDGAYFHSLWDRIKYKTTYRVMFDNDALLDSCIRAVREAPAVSRTRIHWRKADIAIGRAGVDAVERAGSATIVVDELQLPLPNILREIQDRTQLTRRSIHRILVESDRLDEFTRNPQQFIEIAAGAINRCKQSAIAKGISYRLRSDGDFFPPERFEQEELYGYVPRLIADSEGKSVYDFVICDSDVEARFANELKKNTSVKVFTKLPDWYTIATPLGAYNPDWALVVEQDNEERVYLVAETKGTRFTTDLREAEQAKIECGRKHFRAVRVMEPAAQYHVGETLDDVLNESASGR